MLKKIILGTVLIAALGMGAVLVFYADNLKGLKPVLTGPPEDITETINTTDLPLDLPDNFSIEIFAKDLPGARVMVKDILGNIWVSQTKQGQITLLETKDGEVVRQNVVFKNLKNPHGLALDPEDPFSLYVAEENKISRTRIYSDGFMELIKTLPAGGRHTTRTLAFGPPPPSEGGEREKLYVSIGSSCDVCVEGDEERATIYSMDRDGSNFKEFAKGLRNAVFFTWSYVDGRMWATEMGRDNLGDDLPPDEINIIKEQRNYGWPTCYGKNIHDTQFDKNTYIRNPCQEPFETPSYIDIPAHSAPLGIAFIPEEGWPEDMWYDLLIAYHGSWNRTVPTGYKVVRVKLDEFGNYLGIEDFITGWLTQDNRSLGRPVDIIVEPGGIMYVSDDKAGVIYKITYNSN